MKGFCFVVILITEAILVLSKGLGSKRQIKSAKLVIFGSAKLIVSWGLAQNIMPILPYLT